MTNITSKLSFVLYLLVTWPNLASNADMLTKYHIHIMDDLPDPSSKLFVHCKSADSDKGARELSPGQEYGWGTRVNVWRSTLYFCLLKWEGVKERYIVAFKGHRDQGRCKHIKACLWKVRDNGIFFSNDNSTWSNEYPW